MFLTRITTTFDVALRNRLVHNYAWHQKIWTFFPEKSDGKARDFLFRVDVRERERSVVVWILSPERPTENLDGKWEAREIGEQFLTFERYAFSLRANPTVMRVVRDENGERRKNGRRVSIYDDSELRDWLERRGADAGFALETCEASAPIKETFYKNGTKGVHSAVEFRGVLNVVDRQKFVDAYRRGIGSAKGFGFGLLLLKPLADA